MEIPLVEIFVWLLGLCVGSFLNVVVYRLPLGLSISSPRWSFCPCCKTTLRWHENLPLFGWILLRGRCRTCHMPIGVQYPLVEALTALVFVLVYRLLFVEQARANCEILEMPADWAMLLAWLFLAAVLIACSAMDIVSYMVDTGITNLAVVAGIVLYAVSPATVEKWVSARDPLLAATSATFLVSVFMLWVTIWRVHGEEYVAPSESPAQGPAEPAPVEANERQPALWKGITVIVTLAALAAWLIVEPSAAARVEPFLPDGAFDPIGTFGESIQRSGLSVAATLIALFLVMVLSASQERAADDELHIAIEEEAPHARRTSLGEIAWLLPGIAAGALAYFWVSHTALGSSLWAKCLVFSPVAGAAYAMHGAMVAAAAGWFVRIFFTLAFGKEAFGIGDIYILAAAGACAGWDIALLGFLFSIGVALLGFVIGLAMKRTSLIAFGPPLALGFLIALWTSRPSERVLGYFWSDARAIWEKQPWLLSGLLGGSVVLALVMARLSRWMLERGSQSEARH